MSEIKASVTHQEEVAVIRLSGYLSSESAGPLEEAFQQAAEARKVLLVFQEKDFINSAGLALLFDCFLPGKEKGQQFRVVQPSKHFRKVFEIVGLNKEVEVYEAEAQALEDW